MESVNSAHLASMLMLMGRVRKVAVCCVILRMGRIIRTAKLTCIAVLHILLYKKIYNHPPNSQSASHCTRLKTANSCTKNTTS